MTAKTDVSYQGHADRAHWSVSLYLDNEYAAYSVSQGILSASAGLPARRVAVQIRNALRARGIVRSYEGFSLTSARIEAWVTDELAEREYAGRLRRPAHDHQPEDTCTVCHCDTFEPGDNTDLRGRPVCSVCGGTID